MLRVARRARCGAGGAEARVLRSVLLAAVVQHSQQQQQQEQEQEQEQEQQQEQEQLHNCATAAPHSDRHRASAGAAHIAQCGAACPI